MDFLLYTSILLVLGFGVGVLGSMLGLGGGVFLVPILTLLFEVPTHKAIGASVVAVVATSTAATAPYLAARLVNVRLGMLLEVATTLGALTGAVTATLLGRETLALIFGLVLIPIGLSMLRGLGGGGGDDRPLPGGGADTVGLSGRYRSPPPKGWARLRVSNLGKGMAASYVAGDISGLLGIGGGVVKVPIMNLLMRVPIKVATATSNFMVGITGVAGAYIYYAHGFIDPLLATPTAVGVSLGALLGSRLSRRAGSILLRRVFAMVLLYLAVMMLAKGLGLPAVP